MAITSAAEMDELIWARASDQFGTIDSDSVVAGSTPVDTLVETIEGVTYVIGTFENGDIQLHTYENGTFTKIGHYEGGSGTGDTYGGVGSQYTSPTIEKIGDKLIITADTENDHTAGFVFDLAAPAGSFNPDTQGIEFDANFLVGQSTSTGSSNDELTRFVVDGQSYYLHVGQDGDMKAFTVNYNTTTGQLEYVENQDFNATEFNADNPYLGSKLVRADTLDGNDTNIIAHLASDTDFIQLADGTIYSYSPGIYGMAVAKWEVDPATGNMTAAQVVYTDGTTTKDLYELGYVDVSTYPDESPFTPGSVSLADTAAAGSYGTAAYNWLQEIAQIDQLNDLADGSRDVIDLEYLKNAESFVIDGQQYLYVNTLNGSEDGSAVFAVDSNTGLPTQLVGYVEMDIAGGRDADDAVGTSQANFTDVTVSKVAATGEYVISVGAGLGYMQFKFDPTAAPSASNGAGQLTFIGNDTYNNLANGSLLDTSSNGSPMTTTNITQFDILPDGNVLGTSATGYWVADPNLSTVCFAAGTLIETDRGPIKVENLHQGCLVRTKDNGYKPIRWIGNATYNFGSKSTRMRPIRISAGSLGHGLPEADLVVSPQHRILVKSEIARKMCGFDEVLVAAKQLLDCEGINVAEDLNEVTYWHFLFDQHEIVYANKTETESLYTGPEALKAVSTEAREEILTLFPELQEIDYVAHPSRIVLSGRVSRQLAYRHVKNHKPLYVN